MMSGHLKLDMLACVRFCSHIQTRMSQYAANPAMKLKRVAHAKSGLAKGTVPTYRGLFFLRKSIALALSVAIPHSSSWSDLSSRTSGVVRCQLLLK